MSHFLANQALELLCASQRASTPEGAIRGIVARFIRAAGVSAPPVALRPLQKRLGVQIEWQGESDARGPEAVLLPSRQNSMLAGGVKYSVRFRGNPRRNWRRTRFTIAHELVHVLIYTVLKQATLIRELDGSDESHRTLEWLCNVGAAEMLMPAHFVRNDLRAVGLSPHGLLDLYDKYLVSREVLLRRVAELMPGGAIIRWAQSAKPPAETVQFRVFGCYPGYMRGSRRPWLPRGATLRHVDKDTAGAVESGKAGLCEHASVVQTNASRAWRGQAAISYFPTRSKRQKPKFEGFDVEDEIPPSSEVLLLLFENGGESTAYDGRA